MKKAALSIAPAVAMRDKRLTYAERTLLAIIGIYANRTTGWCWPSNTTLAKDLGVEVRNLRRYLARLVELGYIEREVKAGKTWGTKLVYDVAQQELPFDDPTQGKNYPGGRVKITRGPRVKITPQNVPMNSPLNYPSSEPSPTSESNDENQSSMFSIGASAEEPAQKPKDKFPLLTKLKRQPPGGRYLYPPEFDDFWKAYSERRKADSKPDAYRAWRKAVVIEKLDPGMLEACAANYAAYCQQGHEPPLVATWFNKQRWNSQASQGALEPDRGNGNGRLKSAKELAKDIERSIQRDRDTRRALDLADGDAEFGESDAFDADSEEGPEHGCGDDGQGDPEVPAWFDQDLD